MEPDPNQPPHPLDYATPAPTPPRPRKTDVTSFALGLLSIGLLVVPLLVRAARPEVFAGQASAAGVLQLTLFGAILSALIGLIVAIVQLIVVLWRGGGPLWAIDLGLLTNGGVLLLLGLWMFAA